MRTTRAAYAALALSLIAFWPLPGGSIVQTAYRTVLDEGSSLAQQATINFVGAGVTCANNSGASRTDCTIPGGVTSAYSLIQQAGTPLTVRTTLNFTGGVTCLDNGGQTRTDCTGAITSVFGGVGAIPDLSGDCTTSGSSVVTCAGKLKTKSCVVIIGDPGAASSVLADDNDSPVACSNDIGVDWTITRVGCWADAGTPVVRAILTGGSSTSILSGDLTCGTAAWAAGTVNGTVTVHSFSAGATCTSTPCTTDVNIVTAGGTARYIVVRVFGTIP